jgi:hypothetical protein
MINISVNGQNANIRDVQNIGFKSTFDTQIVDLELNVDSIICVNETRKQILDWVAQYGYHVGIPVTISYFTLTFDYYLDLAENPRINSREIEVKIKKRKGSDNFFDLSNGTSFELQARQGLVFNTVNVPYVIIPDNQLELGLTLSLGIYSMVQATIQAIKDSAFLIAEASSAVSGVSVALAISAVAKATIQVAYTTALVVALIQLTQRFRDLIFPKVRYFKGMNVKELLKQSCAELGFTFESTLLDSLNGLTICPTPLVKDKQSIFNFLQNDLTSAFTNGYPTSSDTVPTPWSLIKALETMFYGRTKVTNGVVRFEEWEYFENLSTLNTVPALNLQDKRDDEYTVNTSEAWKRAFIHYQTDFNDIHTLDNIDPTNAEYGTDNVNQIAPELNLIKGLLDVNIPFSQGIRKSEFNWIENLAFEYFSVIDALTGLNTSALIENRLGVMQISQQFYSTTKLIYLQNNRIPTNYLDIIGAKALWTNYISKMQIQQNGFKIYENAPLLLNFEQFEQILNNNYITINNVPCEVISIDFVPYDSKATINYRVPDNYANGKITTFVINE